MPGQFVCLAAHAPVWVIATLSRSRSAAPVRNAFTSWPITMIAEVARVVVDEPQPHLNISRAGTLEQLDPIAQRSSTRAMSRKWTSAICGR